MKEHDHNKYQYNFANASLTRFPIFTILHVIVMYRPNTKHEPKKPNSSENNVNIKSVCFSGKNSK